MSKRRTYWLVGGGGTLLLLLVVLWAALGPNAPIRISRETTYLTSPLKEDGLVDYCLAVERQRSQQVRPQQNGAIPLAKAIAVGWTPEKDRLICEQLDIPWPIAGRVVVPDDDEQLEIIQYWLYSAADVVPPPEEDRFYEAGEAIAAAMRAPWRRDQFPLLADWVESNQAGLDRLQAIENCTHYFLPTPQDEDFKDRNAFLIDGNTAALRSAARCLLVRAMFRLGEGNADAAWRDLRIVFRLSHLLTPSPSVFDVLMRGTLRCQAIAAARQLIASEWCDDQLLQEIEQFCDTLPPVTDMADAIDATERFLALDYGAMVAAADKGVEVPGCLCCQPGQMWFRAPFDRNAFLMRINHWCDQLVSTARSHPVGQARVDAVNAFDASLHTLVFQRSDWGVARDVALNQTARGRILGDIFSWKMLLSLHQGFEVELSRHAEFQMFRVAIALERYRRGTGDYPAQLSELEGRIDADLLADPFSNNPLVYQRIDDRYMLYSVHRNQKDEQGDRGFAAGAEELDLGDRMTKDLGDDLVFRVPLPEFTLPAVRDHGDDYWDDGMGMGMAMEGEWDEFLEIPEEFDDEESPLDD